MRPTMFHRLLLAGLTSLVLLSGPAALRAQPAADAAALRTQTLAAACAACHGTAGQALAGASVPGLAGMPRDELLAKMAGFKAGQREATVMHQIAKGFSDAQIAQLAGWFAAQPR